MHRDAFDLECIDVIFVSSSALFPMLSHNSTAGPPNKPEMTLKCQRYPIYVVQLPNFTPFHSTIGHYQDIGNFSFYHWPH